MSDKSGRWKKRELNRFCERQINEGERQRERKHLEGIQIEASLSRLGQICA